MKWALISILVIAASLSCVFAMDAALLQQVDRFEQDLQRCLQEVKNPAAESEASMLQRRWMGLQQRFNLLQSRMARAGTETGTGVDERLDRLRRQMMDGDALLQRVSHEQQKDRNQSLSRYPETGAGKGRPGHHRTLGAPADGRAPETAWGDPGRGAAAGERLRPSGSVSLLSRSQLNAMNRPQAGSVAASPVRALPPPVQPIQTGSFSGTVTAVAPESFEIQVYGAAGNHLWSVYTDVGGNYSAEGLATGTYYAVARKQGYIRELYTGQPCAFGCNATVGTPISVTDGFDTSNINFSPAVGGIISGNVTDGAVPLENTRVEIYTGGGVQATDGWTDASGNYSVADGLPTGTYYAIARRPGYLRRLYNNMDCALGCDPMIGTPIAVTAGFPTTGVDFALTQGGSISGNVAHGAVALVSTHVQIFTPSGTSATDAWTDSFGDYTAYDGLPTGEYVVRSDSGEQYLNELYDNIPCFYCDVSAGTHVSVISPFTTGDIDFNLDVGGSISGTVTDASSHPLQNAGIEVYDSTGRYMTGANTDASGSYTTGAGLPPGNYYVVVRRFGYLPEVYNDVLCYACSVATSGTAVSVSSGTNTPGIDFTLLQGGGISGRVTESGSGLTIGNAWISIYDTAGNYLTGAWADPSGNYVTYDGLAAGTYYASSSNNAGFLNELFDNLPCYFGCDVTAGAPITVTAETTVTGIDFVLDPGGRISGMITDGASPLANANIQIYDSSGAHVSNLSSEGSGAYTSREGLPNGNYFVRARAQGRISELYNNQQCSACDVTSGTPVPVAQGYTTASINFALDEGGSVSGTVTDAGTSDPLSNASISIMDPAGKWVSWGNTDSSGSYVTYDGLPSGAYYVFAQAQSHRPEVYDNILCLGCDPRTGNPVAVNAGSDTGNIDFALEPGGTISGTVTDESTSQPLSNSWISIADSTGRWMTGANTDSSGHYLSYDGFPSGNYFVRVNRDGYIPEVFDNIMCLSCDVTTGTPVAVMDGADTGNIDFALAPGGTISGNVVDASTSDPLPNTRIEVYNSAGNRVGNSGTGATGDYVSSGLPAGTYFVRARAQGHKPVLYDNIPCHNCDFTSGTPVDVTVGNNSAGIDFALNQGGTISGRVTDAATSTGIGDVWVDIYDSFGNKQAYGYTDFSGNFVTYDGLNPGTYHAVTGNSRGYLDELYNNIPCYFGCDPTAGAPIAVAGTSDTGGIDFALIMGGAISGTITDAGTLAPLSHVQVEITNSSGQHFRNFYTDSLGKYLANGLPSGSYYLKTRKQGYQAEVFDNLHCLGCDPRTGTPISVTLGVTTSNINFALDVGGSIEGTITDFDTSLPLADANIEIINSSGNSISWTNSDGTGQYFSSDGLPAGNYYVRASEQTHIRQLYNNIQCVACNPTTGNPVAVTVGNTTSGIDFVLHKGGNISGVITDEVTGTPLQNAWIEIYDSSNFWVSNADSDNAGNYLNHEGLPTGNYFVRVTRSGYVPEVYDDIPCLSCPPIAGTGDPVPVTAGSTTAGIDFALSPGGSVSGTVTDAITSAPLANVRVAVLMNLNEGWVTSTFTDASGAYVTSGELPGGTYYVRTWGAYDYIDELYDNIPCPSGCSGGTLVAITQGSDTGNINFALNPGGIITGNITDGSTAAPVQNVTIQLFDSTGKQVKTATTNATGSYELRGLPTGSFYVRVSHSDYLSEVFDNIPCSFYCTVTNGTPVVVSAGNTTSDINFDLTPGGNISGTVTDAGTSAPLEGVLLMIYDSDAVLSQYAYAYTDAVGSYRSDEAFPDGNYRVQTAYQHYISELYDNIPCFYYCNITTGTPVVITAATNATDIDFALTRGGTISGTVTSAVTSLPVQGVVVRAFDANGNMMTQGNTNSSGHYQVWDGLPAGTYYVRTINSPGYTNELYNDIPCLLCDVTTGAPIAVTLGSDTPNIDFALNPGGTISGTVIDSSTSLPIYRALIQVFTSSGAGAGSVRTDASGHFTARGLTTGNYFVRASQGGYITEQYDNIPCLGCQATLGTAVPVTTGGDTPGINFALDRGGSISGKVTDASNGAPLAFVEVDIISASTGYGVGSAITDSGGNYSLGVGLPSGTYWAQANWATKGHLGEVYNNIPCILDCDYSSATPVVVAAPATTPNIDFSLGRGTLISGHVTDAVSGLPLDGAQVQVFDSTGAFLYNLFTNVNGEYQALDSLATGTYYALAVRSGYERELYNNLPCAGCNVTSGTPIVISAPGTVSGINFSLQAEPAAPWRSSGVLNTGRSRHTATLLNNGKILVAGGYNGGYLSSAELFNPSTGQWSSAGSMGVSRSNHAAVLLRSGRVMVIGGYNGVYFNSVEVYDPDTNSWTMIGSGMNAARMSHTATLLKDGRVLVSGGFNGGYLSICETFDPDTGLWSATGAMNRTRRDFTATLLADGKVLAAGGFNGGYQNTSETYDPSSGTWTLTTGGLSTSRRYHTTTLLPNGKALAAGGYNGTHVAVSELYDPSTRTWAVTTGNLSAGRSRHSASLMPDGRVLVTGGENSSGRLQSAELFNSASGTWTPATDLFPARMNHTATLLADGRVAVIGGEDGASYRNGVILYQSGSPSWFLTTSMNSPRSYHSATLLMNGKVLVAGGFDALAKSEVYDPSTGIWTPQGDLTTPRARQQATVLNNGKVLINGGMYAGTPIAAAEVYDPSSGLWTAAPAMNHARTWHTSTLLPDGRVLVVGGSDGANTLASCELYNPSTGAWTATGSLIAARNSHAAVMLPNGKVLVAGGQGATGFLDSAELYDPATGVWTPTGAMNNTRNGGSATLLPSGKVLILGGIDMLYFVATTELYDPDSGTWSVNGSLEFARYPYGINLLPDGKVLIAGGLAYLSNGNVVTKSTEVFDPATNSWSASANLNVFRRSQASTILADGKILMTGGSNGGGSLSSCEVYDPGLGFSDAWRPVLSSVTDPLANWNPLVAAGTFFQGISEASAGNGGANSSSNYPVLQLRRLDNAQTQWLSMDSAAGWSDTLLQSTTVTGMVPGPAMATVFTNGIPSRSRFFTMQAGCPAISLSPATLPNGQQGVTYSQTVSASGGTAPYTYTVTTGSLPPGLLLNASTGVISGIPTTPGPYNFTITATDANSCTGSLAYAVNISCPVITVSPATLPDGQGGVPYNQTVSATGGTAPYTYTVTTGSLPPGLLLNASTGAISGTPTTPGSYNFMITAADANSCTGSRGYAVNISCAVITVSPATLPDGQQGVVYSQTVSATGGTAPYTYTVTTGTLPPGLLLNASTGVISGTPTTPGPYNFTITATDANSCTGSRGYAVNISCPVITLMPATLPDGEVAVAYIQTVSASGGTPPYTYTVTTGSLPPGLNLNATTGSISGTPGGDGNFPFEITATDANSCGGARNYAILVNPTPSLFSDDFEDGVLSSSWLYVKPSWTESAGFLRGTPSGKKAVVVAQPAFAGCQICTIDVEMQTSGGAYNIVWLLGWYVDKKNTIELLAKEETDRWLLKQRSNGVVASKGKGIKTINTNTPYHVRISFDGTAFTVFVDDMTTPLFVVTARAAVPVGTVGFQSKNTTASFGYITVQ